MKKLNFVILLVCLFVTNSLFSQGNTFYSKTTGNLNVEATWGSNPDGTGTAPLSFAAGDTFITNDALTGDSWTIGLNGKLVVKNGGIVTKTQGATWTLDFELEDGSTMYLNSNAEAQLSSLSPVNIDSNTIIVIHNMGQAYFDLPNWNFGHLILNAIAVANTVTFGVQTVNIQGHLELIGGTLLAQNKGVVIGGDITTDITIGANLKVTSPGLLTGHQNAVGNDGFLNITVKDSIILKGTGTTTLLQGTINSYPFEFSLTANVIDFSGGGSIFAPNVLPSGNTKFNITTNKYIQSGSTSFAALTQTANAPSLTVLDSMIIKGGTFIGSSIIASGSPVITIENLIVEGGEFFVSQNSAPATMTIVGSAYATGNGVLHPYFGPTNQSWIGEINYKNDPLVPNKHGFINRSNTTSPDFSQEGNATVENDRTVELKGNYFLGEADDFILQGTLKSIDESIVQSGNLVFGSMFTMEPGSKLDIGHTVGISVSEYAGMVQADLVTFEADATYRYNLRAPQISGDGMPGDISTFVAAGINLTMTTDILITDSFSFDAADTAIVITDETNFIALSQTNKNYNSSPTRFVNGPIGQVFDIADSVTLPTGDIVNDEYHFLETGLVGGIIATPIFAELIYNNPTDDGYDIDVFEAALGGVDSLSYRNITGAADVANIVLHYDQNNPGINFEDSLVIAHWSGTEWTGLAGIVDKINNTVSLEAPTALRGQFALSSKLTSGNFGELIPPTPLFSSDTNKVCVGGVISFSNESILDDNVTWGFPGGSPANSNDEKPVITYSTPGTYNVTLTATNAAGSVELIETAYIEVLAKPIAAITAPSSICFGEEFNLSFNGDQTGLTSYSWNLGDDGDDFSGGGPFDTTYLTTGNFDITLTVINDNNCVSLEATKSVLVKELPIASFTFPTDLCFGEDGDFEFDGVDNASATYEYYFEEGVVNAGNGKGPINVTFPTDGDKEVKLVVKLNGCVSDTARNTTDVNEELIIDLDTTNSPGCGASAGELSATVTSNNPASSYAWSNFETTPTISNLSAGSYTVTIVDDNGCSNEATGAVEDVGTNLSIDSKYEKNVSCKGGSNGAAFVAVLGGNDPYSYTWNTTPAQFTDTAINLPAGDYTVTIQDTVGLGTSGCIIVANVTITEPTNILLFNGADKTICAGDSADINPVFSGGTPSLVSGYDFSWTSIPASFVSTVDTINVKPSSTTSYALTITDSLSCFAVDTVEVKINALPSASFSVDGPVCLNDSIDVLYLGSDNGSANYSWSFDGATGVGSNQGPYKITWNTDGSKEVQLIITDTNFCVDSSSVNVTVNTIPTATFSKTDSVCPEEDAIIIYTGTATAGASYTWGFASGTATPGTGQGPHNVNWATSGGKLITLQVEENGCISVERSDAVLVKDIPSNSFSINDTICLIDTALVTYLSNNPRGTKTFTWDFGTANLESGSGIGPYQLTFDAAGNFDVSLQVSDLACVSEANIQSIEVQDAPTATITLQDTACIDEEVIISGGSNDPAASYSWDFANSDSISGAGAGPYTATWDTSGRFTVSLQTSNQFGCQSTVAEKDIYIIGAPVARYTYSYTGTKVDFSFIDSNFINTFFWEFGGRLANSTEANPSVNYGQKGIYQATLKVGNGCKEDSISCFIYMTEESGTGVCKAFSTGINDRYATTSIGVKAFPIPFTSEIKVEVSSEELGEMTITLVNALGQDVVNKSVQVSQAGKTVYAIDGLENTKSGYYFLKIQQNDSFKVISLVK